MRLGRGCVGRRMFDGPNTGHELLAFCVFGPTSCTVDSGAMPAVVAAAWSCERFVFPMAL